MVGRGAALRAVCLVCCCWVAFGGASAVGDVAVRHPERCDAQEPNWLQRCFRHLGLGLGRAVGCAPRKTRILMLMSDTGGGHRASALALSQALHRLFPGEFEVTLYDIWTSSARWPWNRAVPAYRYLGRRPWLWRLLWYGTALWPSRCFSIMVHNAQLRGRFVTAIEAHKPDVVISVHPMCQHVPISALASMGRRGDHCVPFATVVTDLGSAHPLWFDSRADAVFVPTARVARLARFHGLEKSKVIEHGLPLRSAFCDAAKQTRTAQERRVAKRLARRKLGLSAGGKGHGPAGPVVLIAGGGDGFGGLRTVVEETCDTLSREGVGPARVVAVCGNNRKVRAALEARDWARTAPGVDVRVEGFVENMHVWMAAADVLLTKAGPGTIAEASALGLPVLLTSYLPGQERGNVVHVIDSGFGALAKRPERAASLVAHWLTRPDLLATMSHNARRAAKPLATARIAADIAALAKAGKLQPRRR